MNRPTRCSLCFARFMHNHTPQLVQIEGEEDRYMHQVCKESYLRARASHRTEGARYVPPDRDEP